MLLYEIIVIITFILGLIISFSDLKGFDWVWVLTFLLWIWIFLWLLPWSIQESTENPSNQNIQIVSLERWQEVWWSFVLWIWQIETKNVYFAYQMTWDNQYKLVTLPNVAITETNDKKPAYIKVTECKRPYLFAYCTEKENTIYVPKWTIKKQFNL